MICVLLPEVKCYTHEARKVGISLHFSMDFCVFANQKTGWKTMWCKGTVSEAAKVSDNPPSWYFLCNSLPQTQPPNNRSRIRIGTNMQAAITLREVADETLTGELLVFIFNTDAVSQSRERLWESFPLQSGAATFNYFWSKETELIKRTSVWSSEVILQPSKW